MNTRVRGILEKINYQLVVSVDSMIKERYEAIRKGAVYHKTIENLTYFIQLSKTKPTEFPRIMMNVCMMSNNWDEAPDITTYCSRNKIAILFIMIQDPVSLSLKHLGPLTLKVILKKLSVYDPNKINNTEETALYTANEIKDIIWYNKMIYDNMLFQIQQWQTEATQRSTSEIIGAFNLKIKDYLALKKMPDAASMINKINKIIDHQTSILGFSHKEIYCQLIEMPVEQIIALISEELPDTIFDKVLNNYLDLQKRQDEKQN